MELIRVKHLCHQSKVALVPRLPISFNIDAGDCIRIFGGNGSGKTTLLRILAGEISYRGELIQSWPDRSVDLPILPMMSHWQMPRGASIADFGFLVSYLFNKSTDHFSMHCSQLELTCLNQPIHHLSQGFQMRLHMVLLMLLKAHVWLLDEPWVYLDVKTSKLLTGIMEVFLNDGGAIVFSSHTGDDFLSMVTQEIGLC